MLITVRRVHYGEMGKAPTTVMNSINFLVELEIDNDLSQNVLYSHNHNQSQQYIYKCRFGQIQIQADSVVQVRTHLLISDFGTLTRGERHNS